MSQDRPRVASSARSLLLTVLGEFVLPTGGQVWTSTVVAALETVGVNEANARQALARLADGGLVTSQRLGRRARWRLTPAGSELLREGTTRIYGFGEPLAGTEWDGRWLVVLCSVPEDERAKRHALRTRLGFAGFAFVAPGVALCPHRSREDVASEILKDLDLLSTGAILHAEVGAVVPDVELLHRGWDVDALAARYEDFVEAMSARRPGDGPSTFAALVDLVDAWRRFPFVDPEIPAHLLPRDWPARRAKRLFDDRHASWTAVAANWFASLERCADMAGRLDEGVPATQAGSGVQRSL